MKVFEVKDEPLSQEDIVRLKKTVEQVSAKMNRLKLVILIIALIALGVAGFFYFYESNIEAMNISFFVGLLLSAILGSVLLFGFDTVKSSRKILKRNTKKVIIGTITDKQERSVTYKDRKGNSRSTIYLEFYFGPYKDIDLPNKDIYDQYKVGDKIKAYYDFERESILNNEIIDAVSKVELILEASDNPVDLEILKREDNIYNKQLKQHNEDKLKAHSNKPSRMSTYDRKKLTARFGKFLLANILCITLGLLTIFVGFIGIIFVFFGIIFLIISIVKYLGDLFNNTKIIDVKQIDEVIRTGSNKYKTVFVKLSNKKKKKFTLKTAEIDDYDFSHPVLIHKAGFSKNIFDLTFKTKDSV
jgi:hypothetical protein